MAWVRLPLQATCGMSFTLDSQCLVVFPLGFFSQGKRQPEMVAPTCYLAKISRKLHENEENWTKRRGRASKILLCRSATGGQRPSYRESWIHHWVGLFDVRKLHQREAVGRAHVAESVVVINYWCDECNQNWAHYKFMRQFNSFKHCKNCIYCEGSWGV